jgi:hypothetical protein
MSDFSFDPEPEFDPDDSFEGLAINFAYSVACWAAKRAFRFGKRHYPKVRSVVDSRRAVASQWKPIAALAGVAVMGIANRGPRVQIVHGGP